MNYQNSIHNINRALKKSLVLFFITASCLSFGQVTLVNTGIVNKTEGLKSVLQYTEWMNNTSDNIEVDKTMNLPAHPIYKEVYEDGKITSYEQFNEKTGQIYGAVVYTYDGIHLVDEAYISYDNGQKMNTGNAKVSSDGGRTVIRKNDNVLNKFEVKRPGDTTLVSKQLFDEKGNILKTTFFGEDNVTASTSYRYDKQGRLESVKIETSDGNVSSERIHHRKGDTETIDVIDYVANTKRTDKKIHVRDENGNICKSYHKSADRNSRWLISYFVYEYE